MFTTTTLDFENTGVLSSLVLKYINRDPELADFYGFYPDKDGFAALLAAKPYADFDRESLSAILLAQSGLVANASGSSVKNIYSLKEKNTFTVTTGHQLCLFTGPLYFIYKIISTINLAERLGKEFPQHHFVPVYWMASEDHDFKEINNFNVFEKTLVWESAQTGAVGDFNTSGLEAVLQELTALLGSSANATYLTTLFESAYLKHPSLDLATRFLVNELFGEYGLVTIDGNDKAFKQQFTDEFKKDIFDNAPAALVNSSIKALDALGHASQVNPRDINCFYIDKDVRTRIEKVKEQFHLVGTETYFSEKELNAIIDNTPEKISPNVVLRPLYQQKILPNLAYIGGPGELAYWLEFKQMFDALGIVLPVLMPRNFVSVVNKPTQRKMEKLDFSAADFFKPEKDLFNAFQEKTNNVFDLDAEKKKLADLYAGVNERLQNIDKSLLARLEAELKKTHNGFDSLVMKANSALRRRSETELNQIKSIKQVMFPHGIPQERSENFSEFYLAHGRDFFREIKEKTDPFVLKQYIFTEA